MYRFAWLLWCLPVGMWGCPNSPPTDSGLPIDSTSNHSDTHPGDSDTDTGPEDTELPVYVSTRVETSGVMTCEDPSLRSESRYDLIEEASPTSFISALLVGCGLVIEDFTGDGIYDIFVSGHNNSQFWTGMPDKTWVDQSKDRLADLPLYKAVGGSAADVDGDGDMDLYVTRDKHPDVLLINNGIGFFTDESTTRGILDVGHRSMSSSWGDMDLDGDLDLIVGTYGPLPDDPFSPQGVIKEVGNPSHLYENIGDGVFLDQSHLLPVEVQEAHVFMTAWLDINQDHYPELLTIHDYGWARPSRIFWNREGVLEMDDGTSGFHPNFAGMGLGIADLNNDTIPDFLQSSWEVISLLKSSETSLATEGLMWIEYASALGMDLKQIDIHEFGWGTDFGDLDNDGDVDAVMLFGGWSNEGDVLLSEQRDMIFIQGEDGTFVDVAPAWGLDHSGVGRGVILADVNDDGWIDIIERILGGPSQLHLSRCGSEHWLRIKLREPSANTRAIGSRVRVVTGDDQQIRWVTAGSTSMFSGVPSEVHFGLGSHQTIDLLEITWPTGAMSLITNVEANQILEIHALPSTQ